MQTKLSLKESLLLDRFEKVIRKGKETFVEVGLALMAIRDQRLYRKDHGDFGEYCESKWGWSRQRAHQVIQAATVVKSLPPEVSIKIDSPATALAVKKVPEANRERVLATAASTGSPVTAKTIKAAAKVVDAEEVFKDAVGREIPKKLVPLWQRADEIKDLMALVSKAKCAIAKAHEEKDIMYAEVNNTAVGDLDRAYHAIKCGIPYAVCPDCQGHPESQPKSQCRLCLGRGLISQFRWKMVPEEKRNIIEKGVKK